MRGQHEIAFENPGSACGERYSKIMILTSATGRICKTQSSLVMLQVVRREPGGRQTTRAQIGQSSSSRHRFVNTLSIDGATETLLPMSASPSRRQRSISSKKLQRLSVGHSNLHCISTQPPMPPLALPLCLRRKIHWIWFYCAAVPVQENRHSTGNGCNH